MSETVAWACVLKEKTSVDSLTLTPVGLLLVHGVIQLIKAASGQPGKSVDIPFAGLLLQRPSVCCCTAAPRRGRATGAMRRPIQRFHTEPAPMNKLVKRLGVNKVV